MKLKITLYLPPMLLPLVIVAGFSPADSNTTISKKHSVNFYGTLKTRQGTQYKVDNISIDNKFSQIPLIDKPNAKMLPAPTKKNNGSHKKVVQLPENPHKEYSITRIDLSETKEIHAVADTLYMYSEDDKHRSSEFIEVQVISNNKKQTKSSYLIDHNTKVRCDEINDAGPIEKEIPISAVDHLIIEGYSHREDKTLDKKEVNNKK